MAAYKINYFRQFVDIDESKKGFINTEEYDLDGIYDTIEEAEKRLDSICHDVSRYNGVEVGYDSERHILWAEDNLYGQETWQIIEA